jgi:hypothetical protein
MTDSWNARAVPWKVPWTEEGTPSRAIAALTSRTASLSDAPGARLKEFVDEEVDKLGGREQDLRRRRHGTCSARLSFPGYPASRRRLSNARLRPV